jgi:hypothetical protein
MFRVTAPTTACAFLLLALGAAPPDHRPGQKQAERAQPADPERLSRSAQPDAENVIEIAVAPAEDGVTYTVNESGLWVTVIYHHARAFRVFLTDARGNPARPKTIRVVAPEDHPADDLRAVLATCAASGYATATLRYTARPRALPFARAVALPLQGRAARPPAGTIDLTEYRLPENP